MKENNIWRNNQLNKVFSFKLKRITEHQTGFIPSVVQSFNDCVFSKYHMSNTVVSSRDVVGGYMVSRGRQVINKLIIALFYGKTVQGKGSDSARGVLFFFSNFLSTWPDFNIEWCTKVSFKQNKKALQKQKKIQILYWKVLLCFRKNWLAMIFVWLFISLFLSIKSLPSVLSVLYRW